MRANKISPSSFHKPGEQRFEAKNPNEENSHLIRCNFEWTAFPRIGARARDWYLIPYYYYYLINTDISRCQHSHSTTPIPPLIFYSIRFFGRIEEKQIRKNNNNQIRENREKLFSFSEKVYESFFVSLHIPWRVPKSVCANLITKQLSIHTLFRWPKIERNKVKRRRWRRRQRRRIDSKDDFPIPHTFVRFMTVFLLRLSHFISFSYLMFVVPAIVVIVDDEICIAVNAEQGRHNSIFPFYNRHNSNHLTFTV